MQEDFSNPLRYTMVTATAPPSSSGGPAQPAYCSVEDRELDDIVVIFDNDKFCSGFISIAFTGGVEYFLRFEVDSTDNSCLITASVNPDQPFGRFLTQGPC